MTDTTYRPDPHIRENAHAAEEGTPSAGPPSAQVPYVLGHREAELLRLDAQAALLARATRLAMEQAGIGPGMRVLDLGTGTGEVALLAAELVGPTGSVVGVDASPAALAYAAAKCADRGVVNVRFTCADVATHQPADRYDAVVGRLVMAYLPDPESTVRRLLDALRPGGIFVAMDYDLGAMRTTRSAGLTREMLQLIAAGFEAAGTPQTLGPHLKGLLRRAGGRDVDGLGFQVYLEAGDPLGPATISGVLQSLLPALERHGLAAAADLDLATLPERLAADLAAADAVTLMPTLAAAWARRPPTRVIL